MAAWPTFAVGTKINAARLAAMKAYIDDAAKGLISEALGTGTTQALTTLGTMYVVNSSAVVFTLTGTRRIKLEAQARVNQATATGGTYEVRPAYNAGGSVGTPIPVGQPIDNSLNASGATATLRADGTVLLTAGTYTAYALAGRVIGGAATDTTQIGVIRVLDVGAV